MVVRKAPFRFLYFYLIIKLLMTFDFKPLLLKGMNVYIDSFLNLERPSFP